MPLFRNGGKLLRAASGGLAGSLNCCCDNSHPCEQSCTGTAPAKLFATVSGWSNNTCTACADYNGTYELPWVTSLNMGVGFPTTIECLNYLNVRTEVGPCGFDPSTGGIFNSDKEFVVVYRESASATLRAIMQLRNSIGSFRTVEWRKTYDPTCWPIMSFNNESIPLFSSFGSFCSYDGSPLLLTAG